MISSILKPRLLAKNSSDLRTRLILISGSLYPPSPYRTSQIDNGHIPFATTLSTLTQWFMDIPLFSPFFFSSVADYHCFYVTLLLQTITRSLLLIGFSTVAGSRWIDHNSVSSLPTKNLMPCWAVFRHTMLHFVFLPFNLVQQSRRPKRKKTFFIFVNISFYFFQISISISLFRSGERPNFTFGCQTCTFHSNFHNHPWHLPQSSFVLLLNHHHLHIERNSWSC